MPGRVPNRSEDLARPRSRKGGDRPPVTKGELKPVTIPEADENWHPTARMMWDSLAESGQADFYQQSDWAFAYFLCDEMTGYLCGERYNPKTGEMYQYRSPEMMKAILSGLTTLCVTEGDRRRVRIELTEPPKKDEATLTLMSDYREGLEGDADDD